MDEEHQTLVECDYCRKGVKTRDMVRKRIRRNYKWIYLPFCSEKCAIHAQFSAG